MRQPANQRSVDLSLTSKQAIHAYGHTVIPMLSGYGSMGYSGRKLLQSYVARCLRQWESAPFLTRLHTCTCCNHLPSHLQNSIISVALGSSTHTPAAETIVQRATQAHSVRGTRGRQKPWASDNDHAGMPTPREGPAGTEMGVPPPFCFLTCSYELGFT